MKTAKITLTSIKDSDGWIELAYELKFEKFKKEHSELSEYEASDVFYSEVVSKHFQCGEFADLEIEVDEDFNIVGGRII